MSFISRLFASPRPMVAVEVAAQHVAALRISAGPRPAVEAYAVEPLAHGLVVPALAATNITDAGAVSASVARVLAQVGAARHVALVVPDPVARVSLVRFDEVPSRTSDLEAMLRWNVRKSLPFKIDDAQVAWAPGAAAGTGREFTVVAARRDVIAEYEGVCLAAGAHPGLLDIATVNLVNLHLASPDASGDTLLVHLTPDYATLAVVRGTALIFFRHRGADGTESLPDLVHQTAMYYEDRLNGSGFDRVLLSGAAHGPEGLTGAAALRTLLEERIGVRVQPLDPGRAASMEAHRAAEATTLDTLAPLVGILVREAAA
jgi:Tfp pilus assembly PilM family ATPase